LTSTKTPGQARVIGRYGNLFLDTVYVQFGSLVPRFHSIYANPKYILANGQDQAWISAKVVDENGSAVSGVVVNFSASAGSIPAQAVTDENGIVTVALLSIESGTDVTSTVTARVGTESISTTVVFEGVEMSASASPTAILADGRSTSTITVVLKRATSKIAVANAVVQFATTLGTIPNQATTNSEGVARVNLTSATTMGVAFVTVKYGNAIQKTLNVTFQESVPTYLEVTATPPVLPADGQSQSVIRATVTDANRNPVPDGTLVLFEIQSGSGTLERQKTTSNGIATSTLTAGIQPGTTVIRVSVGSISQTVSVIYTVGDASEVFVTVYDTLGNPITTLPADGKTNAVIKAKVLDAQGNPVSGREVKFSTSLGDVTPSALTNAQGIATARFSSGVVGTATITASVKRTDGRTVSGYVILKLLPGSPFTINLRFDPIYIGVRETGKNQTTTIYASVLDGKNNPVADGTLVKFYFMGESLGCTFSTTQPVPTVGGVAQISLTSGTRSGSVRIRAEVVNAQGNPVNPPITSTATSLVIHAGPPYIHNIYRTETSGLTVSVGRQNIWWLHDTTAVTISVFDKYDNPVEQGTAVWLTISGGGITVGQGAPQTSTVTYVDKNGIATAMVVSGNPSPTIDRFYHWLEMQDPNTGSVLPGPVSYLALGEFLLPNFEAPPDSAQCCFQDPRIAQLIPEQYPGIKNGGFILNTEGNTMENDGIARIVAYSVGMDSAGNTVRVWDWNWVVMSTTPYEIYENTCEAFLPYNYTLYQEEEGMFWVRIVDSNGNPMVSGTEITAGLTNSEIDAKVMPEAIVTGAGQGTGYYAFTLSNAIDPQYPRPGKTRIILSWKNKYYSGYIISQCPVNISIGYRP